MPVTKKRTRTIALALCVAALSCVVLSAPVLAVDADPPADFPPELMDMSLEDILDMEITTASKRAQKISDAPAAVTVITREQIRKYGYRTLPQALASVPGFYLTNDRGYTYIGVRGMSIPTDYNIRVLVLLNGLAMNDKYYGTFVPEMLPDLMDAVERVEIVKGPSSTLYGSNALFAIVNVVTRSGADTQGALVSGEVGSGPQGRGVVTYGKALDNGLDLFMSGHYEDGKGENNISLGSAGQASDADHHQLESAYASTTYGEFRGQIWYAKREKEIPTGQFETIVGDDRNTTTDEWTLAELRWERELTTDAKIMMRGYFHDYPYEGVYVYDDPGFAYNVEHTWDRWFGHEAQLNWRLYQRHELTMGAIYEHHWTKLSGHYDDDGGATSFEYPGTSDDFDYWALYVQDEIRVLPSLTFTAGVRYDDYPDFDVDRFSPRAALVWAADPKTTLKFLYGQAFRAPSEFERTYAVGADLGPSSESLDPETISTFEIVAEHVFPHAVSGRLSLFHNEVRDLIVQTSEVPLLVENAGKVTTPGVEVELAKTFAKQVRTFVNATWQDSDFSDGPAINSPEWIANFGVVVPIVGDKLALSLRENFVSDRPTRVPGSSTNEVFLTDLTLSSENALPGWSFNLSLLNLFDDSYGVPSGTDGTVDIIPQPGRTVLFRASLEF